jgi:hypothetical protein
MQPHLRPVLFAVAWSAAMVGFAALLILVLLPIAARAAVAA